jgi:hypothetical protein
MKFKILIQESIALVLFPSSKDLSHLSNLLMLIEKKNLKNLKGLNVSFQFMKEHAEELTEMELILYSHLLPIDPKYVICCLEHDASTLYHEYAHAYFYLYESYRSSVKEFYNQLPPLVLKSIHSDLKLRGYIQENYIDEFQAYLLESPADFGKKHASFLKPIHLALRQLVPRPNLHSFKLAVAFASEP